LHQTCHSTKRTHFIFADFFPYQLYLQELLLFAGAFANGFVLEKRTHLGRIFYGVPAAVSTYSDLRLRREEPRDADAMEHGRRREFQQRRQTTEMLRQAPQSCGIPSYDGTQHDRSEKEGVVCNEDMMASGPLALQIHPEIGRLGGIAYLQTRIAN
jgi:hypothetical protein